MHSSILKRARIAAMLFLLILLVLGLTGTSHAAGFQGGVPWQVGDVVVCFGSGTCRVLRINGSTVTLLDQFSDSLLGDTHGVAINNTLHAVVTDNAGASGSNAVVYSIASVNPLTVPAQTILHTPVNIFPASGGTNSDNAQAVAVDGVGHIFVGNAGSGDSPAPSIVELNPDGSGASTHTFTVPSSGPCAATTLASLDVSADGNSVFFTALDGTIRQVSVPVSSSSTCVGIPITQPGGLSPSITASGISVLPPGSLVGNCSSSVTASVACPNGGFLVVAKGTVLFDFDGSDDAGAPDPGDDTANICTLNDVNLDPTTSCALLLDNSGSIVTTYPITGVGTLQALSLDPLVTDCTGNNCSVSVPLPTVSNFWLGNSQALNFYEVNFGSGTVTGPFTADPTPPAWQATFAYVLGAEIVDVAGHVQKVTKAGTSGTSLPGFNDGGGTTTDGTGGSAVTWTDQGLLGTVNSSIRGLRIYGAEGANQADLTMLSTTALNSGNGFTASVQFPLPFTNTSTNTWTVTEYAYPPGPAPSTPVPVTLYASLIANNSGATDPGAVGANNQALGNTPCEPTTTDPSKCIIWKADLLVPTGDYLAENFKSPTGIDPGTDVFVDLHYDVTTTVGNFDPAGRSSGSVHSLHEITTFFPPSGTGSSACSYISPTPDGACFKNNRTTLPFVFQCTGLTPSQMAGLKIPPGPPLLSMVQSVAATGPKPAPKTVFLTATNTKPPYRYDATANDYVFNWSPPKGILGTFRACTFDPTNTVQTFCTNFTMNTKCP